MLDIFQYSFMLRAMEAGVIIAVISPLIGVFLVLRRYSLIADTLSHVSFAGVALGFFLKLNPLVTAIIAAVASSILIEKLRQSKKVFGESALSIFLSGSLAVAVVLIGLSGGLGADLFSYLFGSITAIRQNDVYIILALGIIVIGLIGAFYKELLYVTVDEEAARVSGIPTQFINLLIIILSALTIALSIPAIGVLLVSALIVIPVTSALQLGRSLRDTIIIAEIISVLSVISGIIISFYGNLPTGGTIVLITIVIFILSLLYNKRNS